MSKLTKIQKETGLFAKELYKKHKGKKVRQYGGKEGVVVGYCTDSKILIISITKTIDYYTHWKYEHKTDIDIILRDKKPRIGYGYVNGLTLEFIN